MKEIVSDGDTLGGSPRLDGTRIGVLHIYEQYQSGDSPEVIASRYDDIAVADVHTALAFVFDNPELVQERRDEQRDAVENIRENRPVDPEEFKREA